MSIKTLAKGRSPFQKALTDVNDGVIADVDAAVAGVTGLRLLGFSARESDATPAVATFRIINGAMGSGAAILVPVELAANESTREWYGPEGIDAEDGISIDWIAGTFDVEIHHKTLP